MIVICTRCQAKFRVADEKIGPRGAKVRCSRCQTVFLVHRDLGTMPLPDEGPPRRAAAPAVDLEPPSHAAPNPFASSPVRAPGPPPLPPQAMVPPSGPAPAPDAPPLDDPFGAAGLTEPAGPDPFGASPHPDPFSAPPQDDPFAPPAAPFVGALAPDPGADPFAAEVGHSPLPVTDLSDLGADLDAQLAPPVSPAVPLPYDPGDDGLALEDRTTPVPRPMSPPAHAFPLAGDPFDGPAAGDPFVTGGNFDPMGYELGGAGQDLALANEPRDLTLEPEARPPPAPPTPPPARSGPVPHAAPAAAARSIVDRVPEARGSRARAVAVNAIGLAALLLAALAMLAVWRNGGRLDAASLRPAALLRVFRSDVAAEPFTTRGVTSGLYERDRSHPILFVRGSVVSGTEKAVRGVKVAVEVVRNGQVIARGEAMAGAVPTPDELHQARDATRLSELARSVASRAPRVVRPGDTVPFLVAMDDHPADLHGATLRIRVVAVEGRVP